MSIVTKPQLILHVFFYKKNQNLNLSSLLSKSQKNKNKKSKSYKDAQRKPLKMIKNTMSGMRQTSWTIKRRGCTKGLLKTSRVNWSKCKKL